MRTIMLAGLVAVLGCGRFGSPTGELTKPSNALVAQAPAVPPVPIEELTAVQLWNFYGKNELAADKHYKGNYVSLTGAVLEVKKGGSTGKYYVGLAAYLSTAGSRFDHVPNVVCYIADDASEDVADLHENAPVKLIAKVVGRKTAPVYGGYLVTLEDARVAK